MNLVPLQGHVVLWLALFSTPWGTKNKILKKIQPGALELKSNPKRPTEPNCKPKGITAHASSKPATNSSVGLLLLASPRPTDCHSPTAPPSVVADSTLGYTSSCKSASGPRAEALRQIPCILLDVSVTMRHALPCTGAGRVGTF